MGRDSQEENLEWDWGEEVSKDLEEKKIDVSSAKLGRRSVGTGLGAALIASICCVTPLVAIALGLGGVSAVFSLFKFRPYFIGISLVFLVLAIGLVLRRNNRSDPKCDPSLRRRQQYLFIISAIGIYLIVFALTTYLVLPLVSAKVASTNHLNSSKAVTSGNSRQLNLKIKGITCASCVLGIKQTLSQKKGVTEVKVSPKGDGEIGYDPAKISQGEILKAIKGLGYKPQVLK